MTRSGWILVLCVIAAAGTVPFWRGHEAASPTPAPAASPFAASPRKPRTQGARFTLIDPRLPIDFGLVPVGRGDQDRRLRFVNDGDEPLVIQDVRGSCCGCIWGRAEKSVFAAGEQGELIVTLRPAVRRGDLSVQIVVTCNARACPAILATARVVNDVEVTPPATTFLPNHAGAQRAEVVLTNNLEGPLRIARILSPVPELHAEVAESRDGRVRLLLRLDPGAPTEFKGSVHVELESPRTSAVAISVICLREGTP